VVAGKIGGIAVHIGARVAMAAQPDEVVVSSTVKDLVAGSGLTFAGRGYVRLKGVPGEWHLYAVDPALGIIATDAVAATAPFPSAYTASGPGPPHIRPWLPFADNAGTLRLPALQPTCPVRHRPGDFEAVCVYCPQQETVGPRHIPARWPTARRVRGPEENAS
jgi:hypothetical protein